MAALFLKTYLLIVVVLFWTTGRERAVQAWRLPSAIQQRLGQGGVASAGWIPGLEAEENAVTGSPATLETLLEAIQVMQDDYFSLEAGTWPDSIDWTAAVLGTHVSATLSTLHASIEASRNATCPDLLRWSNLFNGYFAQTSAFYFGENALGLRGQAYDDMLWVVLGWIENIKFIDSHTSLRPNPSSDASSPSEPETWHGNQFKPVSAHRARIFYELASRGWDTSLCDGGMIWSPHLIPYKNSITNELFISASVSMYLYFPGDDNDSPFAASDHQSPVGPHHSKHLDSAIDAYAWLNSSKMRNPEHPGLYADGFHISGWHREPSGRINPGTGNCDQLNTMVYTYNQGVVLTGLRGLFLATSDSNYLDDGHALIQATIDATGWPNKKATNWAGLGRGGVLEEYCDSRGGCSQNGHTFKGIFFHHMAEFCRPWSAAERKFLSVRGTHVSGQPLLSHKDRSVWRHHLHRCSGYYAWLKHNAHAAAVTRDDHGKFGTWWGRQYPYDEEMDGSNAGRLKAPDLPVGATDYANQNETSPPQFTAGRDVNDQGRGRTVETQSGGVAVFRALWQWESLPELDTF